MKLLLLETYIYFSSHELTTALTPMLTTYQLATSDEIFVDSTIVPQFQRTSENNMSLLANVDIRTTPTQEITTKLVGSQSTITFEQLMKNQLIHNNSYL